MTSRIVIDRFESDLAVLECGGSTWNVPRALLPPGAAEGDVLQLVVDADATRAARDDAAARLARLKARTPQGPGTFDL
jgi:hypothetical protein